MGSLNRRSAPTAEYQGEGNGVVSLQADGANKKGQPTKPSMLKPSSRTWANDGDIQRRWTATTSAEAGKWFPFLALSFQAIGVVYGDIGTSFIYTVASVFTEQPSEEDVIGVGSLLVYVITSLVLVKYALIVLRADDNGQGGTFALFSILKRQAELSQKTVSMDASLSQYSNNKRASIGRSTETGRHSPTSWRQRFIGSTWTQTIIRILVVAGVGAIMGDGVLTPSVSIVSACEGINVKWPSVTRGTIDGIAVAIVVVLFFLQRFGTGFVGTLFSPIISLWLLSNAILGVYNIAKYKPGIFIALSPHKWFDYFLRNGTQGWRSLGGILLAVTGCEALFADLGHFNRRAVQCSFAFFAWPCLVFTYLGQSAYLTKHPENWATPYWSALPDGTFYYMWILATLASIIASQALISAAFQIIKQAIAQGFFPRFTIIHTSKKHKGQIYIPFICYILGALCILLILTFRTSAQLTQAYGLAVLIDMMLTTHFITMVMLSVWKLPFYILAAFYLCFTAIEGTILSATVEKVPHGAWFTLMVCAIYAAIMLLWFWGSKQKNDYFINKASNLSRLLQTRSSSGNITKRSDPNVGLQMPIIMVNGQVEAARLPGIGVYYSDIMYGAPPSLEAQVTRFPALHQVNVVLTIRFVPVPEVLDFERLLIKQLPVAGFYHVVVRYGYSQQVKQDEAFVDMLMQQISVLLYSELQDFIHAHPDLQATIQSLPPPKAGDSPRAVEEIGIPILGHNKSEAAFLEGAEIEMTDTDPSKASSSGDFMARKSAPVAALVKNSLVKISRALHPSTSAQFQSGFHDVTFQAAPAARDFNLDAITANLLSSWAARVVKGEILVPSGLERSEQLARDIDMLSTAREHGTVFVVGKTQARSPDTTSAFKKYLIHEPFLFLVHNFTSDSDKAFGIPEDKLAIVGLPFPLT